MNTPYQPKWFQQSLTATFGSNLYGEPNLKVVFGASERDHRGNVKYTGLDGNPLECWCLVRWQHPSFFGTKDAWDRTRWFYDDISQKWIDLRGEYPSRGDYVFICPLSNSGEFLALDESVFEAIRAKVRADEEFFDMQELQRNALVQELEDEKAAKAEYQSQQTENETDEYYRTNWDRINREGTRGYNITPR